MRRLIPKKLHVKYLPGTDSCVLAIPRLYTLTHSDITGDLFLTIGPHYDTEEISKLYTRLMRDEVLAELKEEHDGLVLNVYCHVSGGFVLGKAGWRYSIFRSELPLALEALRYGDKSLFDQNPELDQVPVFIHFRSSDRRYNKIEPWGIIADYKHYTSRG
jgi:hypothetical protein